MPASLPPSIPPPPPGPDLGRRFAQLLCVLFSLVGVVPLLAGYVAQTSFVQAWAVQETRDILEKELGLRATFTARLELLPLKLRVDELTIPATDKGGPVLYAETASITPRLFSLLAGQLDVGDIEIERSRARLKVGDGALKNVAYRLPKRESKSELKRAPFRSLALTDATLSVEVEGTTLTTSTMDLDVLAGADNVFEVALRTANTKLYRERTQEYTESEARPAFDEDMVCRLDARVRIQKGDILVRRLALLGLADTDLKRGTTPDCQDAAKEDDVRRTAVRASGFRLLVEKGGLKRATGHAVVRAPAALGNRLVKTYPIRGWAAFSGDVHYDGSSVLPNISGRMRGDGLKLGKYKLADSLDLELRLNADLVRIPRYSMRYADAKVLAKDIEIEPLREGAPVRAKLVENRGMTFQGLMRDIGVTPNTIVRWGLDKTDVHNITGTLAPLHLDARLDSETTGFEVTDKAFHNPARQHMIGIKSATIRGQLRVRPDAFQLADIQTKFGQSALFVRLVSIGFDPNVMLKLSVPPGNKVHLADISPLTRITLAGEADIDAEMSGPAADPILTGNMNVKNFVFGGFPLGDLERSKLRFRPLKVEISEAVFKKGSSSYRSPTARLNFDGDATVEVDGIVRSDAMDLRDFMAIWHFENDPRWTHVKGVGRIESRVHYLLGGPRDRCKTGALSVRGSTDMRTFEAFDEVYDHARSEFEFVWDDIDASYRGFMLDVPSFALGKGGGTLLGSTRIDRGGLLSGKVLGTSVPISKINALGHWVSGVTGNVVTAVGELGGTLDAIEGSVTSTLSPLAVGPARLPASSFRVRLEPVRRPIQSLGTTACGHHIAPPFDLERYNRDEVQGHFVASGQLFGNQLEFDGLKLSVQRDKVWSGKADVNGLDLSAVAEILAPSSGVGLSGSVSGQVDVGAWHLARPHQSELDIRVTQLNVQQGSMAAQLRQQENRVSMKSGQVVLGGVLLEMKVQDGPSGLFDVQGKVSGLGRSPRADLSLALRPTALSAFLPLIPGATEASGNVDGNVEISGPLSALSYSGGLRLSDGEIGLKALKTPITDLQVQLAIEPHQLRITDARAKLGPGTLSLRGSAPLSGVSIGTANADLSAKGIVLPVGEGIKATVDAELNASFSSSLGEERNLPLITGDVVVTAFNYTRPMSMTADIASLAGQGRRTKVTTYDPDDEVVRFDLQLFSQRPFTIKNDLVQSELEVGKGGLRLRGTNQRFGLLGSVKLKPGGQVRLRSHEFEIRQGSVRFDDLNRIAPHVDITAVTEYRRYDDTSGASTAAAGGGSAALGGQWRINLHAYGDPENLKIDLTSTPNLQQDDIFLLLTVGLTRTELDQTKNAGVGSSVALEALGTLSGADRVVTDAVPVIDDASMGSSYNPKTGRTEPTITIGKRLAERIRAQVTTGLSDSSEVRSRIRMQISPQVSLEGSYDNVNDISNSALGNVGADVRWRLEFD